ncbi:tetratricopeptide repeat protein [uncultured Rummeliibacillus sp.]|uniref:tetratricopeptide repeat protein n=1 Tax=uncultured Rummeliibacillus sp. TaxID=762292 RepID=UPI0026086D5B|nr:tetratricopeptide repeat protein [uncultured Rummeliibacillus sp.]
MRNKRRKLQKHENVIVFPGAVDRLITEGQKFAENYQYDKAVESLREALQYTDDDEGLLSIYAFSLYETRNFQEAKAVCEKLLAIGPQLYIETMELYLTVLMELKEFNQVETLISSLLEEDVIPPESQDKFIRIKNLNAMIADSQSNEQPGDMELEKTSEQLKADTFFAQTNLQQMKHLQAIRELNLRPLKNLLVAIIEDNRAHPMIQSFVLYLLVQQEIDIEVQVRKFDKECTINPIDLDFPDELPVAKKVLKLVEELLEQEPTTLEMVQYLLTRHMFVTYPFEWFQYSPEEVADGYIDFVHAMFGEVKETDYDLLDLINLLEEQSELFDV